MATTRKNLKTARTRKSPKAKRLAELNAEAKRYRDRVKHQQKAIADDFAAREELRKIAAEWVAAIRSRVVALAEEVNKVLHESRPGTVLHGVLDHLRLSALGEALDRADCESAALNVANYDMPIPALLLHRDYVCTKLFPLAAEGARLFTKAEPTEPKS